VLKHEASLTLGGAKPGPAAATPRKAAKLAPAELPAPAPAPISENERTKEREAVAKLLRSPFAFDSFMSFFLFVIRALQSLSPGGSSTILSGLWQAPPQISAARLQRGALQRHLGQSNAIMTRNFKAINRKIELRA
jgi:hypothetical protein